MKVLNYKRYIYKVLFEKRANPVFIHDYAQDIMIKLLSVPDEKIMPNYIARTVENYLIDNIRPIKKRGVLVEFDDKYTYDTEYLKDYLDKLSKIKDYEMFLDKYYFGFSSVEIADSLGIKPLTVRTKIHRFKEKARKLLKAA